jgi:hypothetical protein
MDADQILAKEEQPMRYILAMFLALAIGIGATITSALAQDRGDSSGTVNAPYMFYGGDRN